jgi:hypothetical protein
MENITVMNKFNNEVTNYYKNKTNAVKQPWTITTIFDTVFKIAASKISGTKKNSKQYRLIKNMILNTIHNNIGHGGRDKIMYALKDKYK